jgi:hypothetical protein
MVIERLDRIIEILEDQTYPPTDAVPVCLHENAVDIGTMGMRPGERMQCAKCGAVFSREEPITWTPTI